MIGIVYRIDNKQIIAIVPDVQSNGNDEIIGKDTSVKGIDLSQASFCLVDSTTQQVGDAVDSDHVLNSAKQAKLAELQGKCNNALATFTSYALGAAHTYLSGQTDMLLLESEDRYMGSADYDGVTPVLWYTTDAGDINHSKAQLHQVYLDARSNVQTVKYKMKNLAGQVSSATTVAAVNAIVW